MYSQSIQNTEWELYLEDEYEGNILFENDTLYFVSDDENLPISIFTESIDTFTIKDIEGEGCYDIIGDIWSTYTFQIQNDTLSFDTVVDSCEARVEVLADGVLVKLIDTSTEDKFAISEVSLFPNPIMNGILNIKSPESIDQINVYDSYGNLLFTRINVSSIDFSGYPNKLYFVELKSGKSTSVRKVIKQ